MLKQRLLTAAILVPLVVWGILRLPTDYLALVLALFVIQGGWEWSGLMKMRSVAQRGLYTLVVAASLAGAWWMLRDAAANWMALPVLSLFWWLLAIAFVLHFPNSAARWSSSVAQSLIGLIVLVPTWLAVIALHESGAQGPLLVLYLLSLIWVADSGAYFGGRAWGRHKLAPAVSPGKTWEGVASGALLSLAYALGAAQLLELPGNQWPLFVVLSLITVLFSVLGDLTESMFKRHAGIKDSGTLLPGHGGVLDRIDSVTAAAPVFVVGYWLGGFTGLTGAGISLL
ncbi:MAG: phosphatidate cytidylyltransferase [Gammaproteobacteria bacterium]|nr:phosphatidate cytidylyltransferase [Gammaproteobacteria bacterium]